jgi:hypothetical protein
MSIPTSLTIEVFPDDDYHYSVTVNNETNSLQYHEEKMEKEITFASIEEMKAVANAMLRAAELYRASSNPEILW